MAESQRDRCACKIDCRNRPNWGSKGLSKSRMGKPVVSLLVWITISAVLLSVVNSKEQLPNKPVLTKKDSPSQENKKRPSETQDASVKSVGKEGLPAQRERSHIHDILNLDRQGLLLDAGLIQDSLKTMKAIYRNDIEPLAEAYKFHSMGHPALSDGELDAKPMVLFLGPWSSGKSSMINYLVGLEANHKLPTGAEPVTADFTVIMHGQHFRTVEGLVLATDGKRSFGSLERFGNGFLERFTGLEYPHKVLQKVTLVDTPGIIENRKQQERGYPFNEVCEWFMDRADLIFVVFDPTKLDVGTELESTFKRLKGRESQIRIVLNKADTIAPHELMRVYGALFWNLAPLINVTEPPRVYVGSFWDKSFQTDTYQELFLQEEKSLLMDLNNMIENQLHNKIAMVRRLAKEIRIHAFLVNEYLKRFNRNRPLAFVGNPEDTMKDIVENPARHNIFKSVLAQANISKYDLPDPDKFKDFFAINAIDSFQPLENHCGFFSGCLMEKVQKAISTDLPKLLERIQKESETAGICLADGGCTKTNSNKYTNP